MLCLLKDRSITLIVVEHKDRLTRFGFRYIETLSSLQGRANEVVNQAEDGKENLLQVAGKHYLLDVRQALRATPRKTETIVNQLKAVEGEEL